MPISETEIDLLTSDAKFHDAVAKQFAAVNLRLSTQDVAIDALSKQGGETAQKLDVLLTQTGAIVEAWKDGAEVKRFFCRLAKVWEFMLKRVAIPGIATIVVLIIIRAIFWHVDVPSWFMAAVKLLG